MNADRYHIEDVQWPETPFDLMKHAVLVGKRGSEAHGTYVPQTEPGAIDDRDIMGICIPPLDYYFGLKLWEGKEAIKDEWDVVLYSFRKAVGLLAEQNPNILCMLWLRNEDYLYLSQEGQLLVANRELFRSKNRAYKSFVGYANGQLHRMTAIGAYKGYMGDKRKKLVDKFGYDTKNAAHMVRLLKMGFEYLTTGELKVFRDEDRQELLDIKQGKWELTDVKLYADKLFRKVNEAMDKSPLPEYPDLEAINHITRNLTQMFFERNPEGLIR